MNIEERDCLDAIMKVPIESQVFDALYALICVCM